MPNFFGAVEQMICEAVMSDGINTVQSRRKAIAVRDMVQMLLKTLDPDTITADRDQIVERLEVMGSALAAGMGVFVVIGCMNDNTPEIRASAYKALSGDAEGFAKIIGSMMESFLKEAKRQRGMSQ